MLAQVHDHFYSDEGIQETLAALTLTENTDPTIYADSGATSHMDTNTSKVYNIHPCKGNNGSAYTLEMVIVYLSHT